MKYLPSSEAVDFDHLCTTESIMITSECDWREEIKMDGTVEKEYTHKIIGIKLQASRIKHLCSLTLK